MRLEGRGLGFRYNEKSPWLFRDFDFRLEEGERVGLIGPSGCGKSTLVKVLCGYETPAEGCILLGEAPLPARGVCPAQRICQHPETAINPRWKLKRVLLEAGVSDEAVLGTMGIEPAWLERYPRELSSGELQRFCIARSLADGVRFLLADEISTMLDVVTQAQIWALILGEAERRSLGLLVVTHNMALAKKLCDRIITLV